MSQQHVTPEQLQTWLDEEHKRALCELERLCVEAQIQQQHSYARTLQHFFQLALFTTHTLSNKLTRCAGKAHPQRKEVKLSAVIFCEPRNAHTAEHSFRNTCRHELAHVLCAHASTHRLYPGFYDGGHGQPWRKVCKLLGGDAKRCHTLARPAQAGKAPTNKRATSPRQVARAAGAINSKQLTPKHRTRLLKFYGPEAFKLLFPS